jgi:aminoglycoside phosphotransferase family enzyme
MKHLLEFDSYSPMEEAEIKGGVPVYNEDEFNKNTNAKPAMVIKVPEIISVVNKFITDQEKGEIEKIVVLAEIPSQGKNAPKYVLDDAAAERERQIQRKTAMYGSRTERSDRPDDDEQTDAINIFVDSEFIVKGVINKLGKDYILAIPESKKKKAESSKEMLDYYTVEIEPRQVFEIFFSPKGM